MMLCTLDTVTNSLCADWMTPLKSSKKRPIVRRLSAKMNVLVTSVVPAPLVRSFKVKSSGSSEDSRSDERTSSNKSSKSKGASANSVAIVPEP
jgi:hypothetical protein